MNLTENIYNQSPINSPTKVSPVQQNTNISQIGGEISDPQTLQKTSDLDKIVLDEFKDKVKKWLEFDNEIKALEQALKVRKKNRKDIQVDIMDFMGKYNIKDMNTDEGKLTYNETKTKKPINQEYLKKTLSTYFNNDEDSNKITAFLLEKRETVSRISLKRSKNGKK